MGVSVVSSLAATAIIPAVSRAALTPATQIASGDLSTCALLGDGGVRCWGNTANDGGALPATVQGITQATQIAAGSGHFCAVLANGTARCWGQNEAGQLGNGATAPFGDLVAAPVAVTGLAGVKQVGAGGEFSCALLDSGEVKCWGYNRYGQLGDGTTTNSLTPVSVTGITDATQISVGHNHSCATVTGGAVKCWGVNTHGELGNGSTATLGTPVTVPVPATGLTGVTQISAGEQHTCAIASPGWAWCWGSNDSNRANIGFDYDSQNNFVPKEGVTTPTSVAYIYNYASQVVAGGAHSCLLMTGGLVKCWGSGVDGQLGDGGNWLYSVPQAVSSITDVRQLALGWKHSCALLGDGSVSCWGSNGFWQLGLGAESPSVSRVPVKVPLDSMAKPDVTGVPTMPVRSGSLTLTVGRRGVTGSTLQCSLDGATPTACPEPLTLTGLSDGRHTLAVSQSDRYASSDQASVSFTINTAPPARPVILDRPSARTSSGGASFRFGAEAGATLSCSLDGAEYMACGTKGPQRNVYGCDSDLFTTSPCWWYLEFGEWAPGYPDQWLKVGSHSLAVRQTTTAGVTSAPATATWDVDRTMAAPVAVLSKPPRITNSPTVRIAFTSTPGGTFTCKLDDALEPSPCTSPITVTVKDEIQHTLLISHSNGLDSDTFVTSSGQAVKWGLDTTPPSLAALPSVGRIRSATQTTYRLRPRADASAIAKVEYTTASRMPSTNAGNVPARTVAFSARVVIRTAARIKFLRVRDGAGNWSVWYPA